MKVLAEKHADIQKKLKDEGASNIPEPEFVPQNRLRACELEIETERKKRIERETVLMDIRRECRGPFIVLALLDAFIDVSKSTTAAVDLLDAVK
ncbi:uncharacterized protein EV420DRAFT_1576941 [Desarmillaria tabescens]|uniref:Uncharacterized protein n=1 Tax=Armillaria tabescens TaxID=1929756 RepID=A0AA39JHY3_ARMTA|nr:uncharacterized protein EV420DRAFT_1576941 [Desarmillaria tabescens]KAK0443092.1 hypothetical protein EV420DRAFT_1576941 [Desarmillaria tabescens]